ncbi:hypothetical protein GCM10009738_12470 [Kitasatospora viridis]
MTHIRLLRSKSVRLIATLATGAAFASFAGHAFADTAAGDNAAYAATTQVGCGYNYGGTSCEPGYDSSGLTQWAWAQAGYSIPRTVVEQWSAFPGVALSGLQPGDLVFFDWSNDGPRGVGIFVGNGQIVTAGDLDNGVVSENISSLGDEVRADRPTG